MLFALYPTVMALNYVSPLIRNLSLPINMLTSNMLSVAMLTWLLMPRVSRFLGFWLNSNSSNWRREARGFPLSSPASRCSWSCSVCFELFRNARASWRLGVPCLVVLATDIEN